MTKQVVFNALRNNKEQMKQQILKLAINQEVNVAITKNNTLIIEK